MRNEIKLEPSEELTYWIGVMQTDGSYGYYTDNRGIINVNARLSVSPKSAPMFHKFIKISSYLLKHTTNYCICRKTKYNKLRKNDPLSYTIGVKTFLKEFDRLGIVFGKPPIPPKWCLQNINFFGAYLAGIIDGDGSVCIRLLRRKNRKSYYQCRIQIFSSKEPLELRGAISTLLKCNVNLRKRELVKIIEGRKTEGVCYHAEFFVSRKNFELISNFILPHMVMPKKREYVQFYLDKEIGGRPGVPVLSHSTTQITEHLNF